MRWTTPLPSRGARTETWRDAVLAECAIAADGHLADIHGHRAVLVDHPLGRAPWARFSDAASATLDADLPRQDPAPIRRAGGTRIAAMSS